MWMIFYSVEVQCSPEIDVIKTVTKKFKISAEANNSFKYLDLLVSQTNNGIKISQKDYIENLKATEVL